MKKFLLILLFCVLSTHSFTQEKFVFSNRAYIWAVPIFQDNNIEYNIMFCSFELYFDDINGVLRIRETNPIKEDWVIKDLIEVNSLKGNINNVGYANWRGKTGYQNRENVSVEIKYKNGKAVSFIVEIEDLFSNIYTRSSEATDPLLR